MTTDVAVTEAELDRATAERVIETAMGLVLGGRLSASDAIDLGCMTPVCLTSATLRKVARAAGVRASSLVVS